MTSTMAYALAPDSSNAGEGEGPNDGAASDGEDDPAAVPNENAGSSHGGTVPPTGDTSLLAAGAAAAITAFAMAGVLLARRAGVAKRFFPGEPLA